MRIFFDFLNTIPGRGERILKEKDLWNDGGKMEIYMYQNLKKLNFFLGLDIHVQAVNKNILIWGRSILSNHYYYIEKHNRLKEEGFRLHF